MNVGSSAFKTIENSFTWWDKGDVQILIQLNKRIFYSQYEILDHIQ